MERVTPGRGGVHPVYRRGDPMVRNDLQPNPDALPRRGHSSCLLSGGQTMVTASLSVSGV